LMEYGLNDFKLKDRQPSIDRTIAKTHR
jgi:hypothetical protein